MQNKLVETSRSSALIGIVGGFR